MARDYSGRRGRTRDGRERDEALRDVRKDQQAKDPLYKKRDDIDADLDEAIQEFRDWEEMTLDDRESQEEDRDFYDGYQWTQEEIDELNDRGQPVIVKNRIAPKINFVLGTETENRVQPRAWPRTPHHDLDAEAVTDALRYVADKDDFDTKRSAVAGDQMVEGGPAGGVFEIQDGDPTMVHLPWDRIYVDPRSRRPDYSDARFMGFITWMYRDEAEDELLGDMDPESDEGQRILDLLATTYSGQTGESTEDRPHAHAHHDDRVRFFTRFCKKGGEWYRSVWTWAGFIEEPTPVEFVDEDGRTWCPMWLTSAYVDRENGRYGIVRGLKSPQEMINKHASKALDLLIHPDSVIAEIGAIPNPDEFMQQRARSGGLAEVRQGALKDQSVLIRDTQALVAGQMQLGQSAEATIDQVGPHAAQVAADDRQQSGRLYIARQQAAALELKPVFDHLRHWTLGAFRRYWWLIRQFWTEAKWLRVQDSEVQTGYRFVAINRDMTRGERVMELIQKGHQPLDAVAHVMGAQGAMLLQGIQQQVQAAAQQQRPPAAAPVAGGPPQGPAPQPAAALPDPLQLLLQSPLAQEPYRDADVAQIDVDLVLDTTPDTAIVRHEQLSEFMQLVGQSPLLAQDPRILGELIRLMDLRHDEKRRILGHLEPKPPDPAQQQAAQQQMQLALAELQAKVEKLQSETAKNRVEAQAVAQEAQLATPAAARLDMAQADLAAAKAQAVPHEAHLKHAQAVKAEVESVPPMVVMTPP